MFRKNWIHGVVAAAAIATFLSAEPVAAQQDYPDRPITMIVPHAPGGGADIVSRLLAEAIREEFDQPIVVENRAGGNSVIGTNTAARARPDGYTIVTINHTGALITLMQSELPYDLRADFVPIIGLGTIPYMLFATTDSQIGSIEDLASTAEDGGLVYGSAGTGSNSHLSMARLLGDLGLTATHVPYRGTADATRAIMTGQVPLFFGAATEAAQLSGSGSIEILAVTGEERLADYPDVPTMAELGHGDFNAFGWYAVLAPAGLPNDVLAELRRAFARAAENPTLQQRLTQLNALPVVRTPEELDTFIDDELVSWGRVVEENDIRIGN